MAEDEKPAPASTPIDVVIDLLGKDGFGARDRGRLGDALGGANRRADGDKVAGDRIYEHIRRGKY